MKHRSTPRRNISAKSIVSPRRLWRATAPPGSPKPHESARRPKRRGERPPNDALISARDHQNRPLQSAFRPCQSPAMPNGPYRFYSAGAVANRRNVGALLRAARKLVRAAQQSATQRLNPHSPDDVLICCDTAPRPAACTSLRPRADRVQASVVGVLHSQAPDLYSDLLAGFPAGLKETGFVEGQTLPSNIAGQTTSSTYSPRWQPISFEGRRRDRHRRWNQ